MFKHLVCFVSFTLATYSNSVLYAELVVDFDVASVDGVNFTNVVSARPGDTLEVGVYLRRTDATDNRLNDLGLATFGLAATYSSEFVSVVAVRRNTGGFPLDLASNTGIKSPTEFAIAGETFDPSGVRGDSILMGSFVFDVTGPGDTTFFIGDIDSGFDDFTLTNFVSLDGELFSANGDSASTDRSRTYGFTVSAVPEPSTLFLTAVAIAGTTLRRQKRQDQACG